MCRKEKLCGYLSLAGGVGMLLGVFLAGPFWTVLLAGGLVALGILLLNR